MPKQLKDAYISIEDERFEQHKGVDIKRTLGATITYILNKGKSSYGGSTITQQLIKNLMKDDDDSGIAGIKRKIREISRAYKTEQVLSKDQILELYLNTIFVGGEGNLCGVALGARYYFNKSVGDLDLAECAFLAGINHSPNTYNPFKENPNTELIKKRTNTVLNKMYELGKINNEEYESAKAEVEQGLKFEKGNTSTNSTMSYLARAALNQVIQEYANKNNISVDSAKASTKQAKANLDKALRDFNRSKNLYKQQSISQQSYQDSLTTYTNAQSSYTSALSSQKRLEVEKDKMLIKSPLKGVVISKDVEVGEWVTTGGKVAGVATLTYEAKVYIPESVLAYVKAGQQVVVRTSRKEYTGKVLSINSKGDPATRLFLTRIDLGQDPDLKEGILTTALIPSGAKINSLLIPRDALVERNNVKGVFKVVEDNRVRFVPVKVIGYNGGYLAVSSITEGTLKKDDSVVLDGNNVVNNGVKIKITSKIG